MSMISRKNDTSLRHFGPVKIGSIFIYLYICPYFFFFLFLLLIIQLDNREPSKIDYIRIIFLLLLLFFLICSSVYYLRTIK